MALDILLQLFEQHTPLTHLLQKPALSPLTKALCFGVARHYTRLDVMAASLVDKRPKDLLVWLCLLMGLYEIDGLSSPDYAVVQETVALLQHHKKTWAKGFVNAILRRFCRDHAKIKSALHNNAVYTSNHPQWLLTKIQHNWPLNWQAIVSANDQHPPMTLRVNQQILSREIYCAELTSMGMEHSLMTYNSAGLVLAQASNVQDIPGFLEGQVSVQDGAAQLAATLLDLQPGLRVLDACCAPGGKTGHILELEPQLLLCLGIDIEPKRLERVQENAHRLHLKPCLQVGDASQPQLWWDGVPFDRILLDAPCSATGIIRRHPDIKHLRTLEDIMAISRVQTQLLEALWPLLAPGGVLVYATCSIMPEENEQQIAHFISTHPDALVDTTPKPWGISTGHGWQILPGEHQMDGFFYSKIQRSTH